MAAHAIARGDAARDRGNQPLTLLTRARCVEIFALIAPAHHAFGDAAIADDPGVKEVANLDLAGFGALVVNDQIELVIRADFAVHIDFAPHDAKVLLYRAGRCTSGARRAVKAVAYSRTNA